MSDSTCIFCKIRDEEIPADIVYRDDRVLAFRDIQPQAPVHIQIIPLRHISTVLDMTEQDEDLIGHMVRVGTELARREGIDERGFRLVMNCKEEAGQSVFHIHLHLLGGRPFRWPPG